MYVCIHVYCTKVNCIINLFGLGYDIYELLLM